MKKRLTALILLMILLLTGCGSKDNQEPDPTAGPTAPAATEAPVEAAAPADPAGGDEVDYSFSPIEFKVTATATPVPEIGLEDYIYIWKIDEKMRLKYMVPQHWNIEWGEHTVAITEPVNAGEEPARIALSSYKVGSDQPSEKMKTHLKNLLKSISTTYDSFSFDSTVNRKNKFIRYYGYSVYYTGMRDGAEYRGYVIICNIGKWIYSYHYSADTEKFNRLLGPAQKVLTNVARIDE